MKRLIVTSFTALIFLGCMGQRYEIWANSAQRNNTVRGNYGFSNDSVLMLYSNPIWFVPSRDIHFAWEDVMRLQIRNRSRNEVGVWIGSTAGGLIAYLQYRSLKKNSSEGPATEAELAKLLTLPLYPLVGTITGHLLTGKKTEIHLRSMSPKEKNQQLKSKMKRKDK